MRLKSYSGLAALVTGASSGIGRLLALRLGQQGARVALVARREAELDEVASEIRAQSGEASGVHRIRHYGLFANGGRTENLARARQLLAMPTPDSELGDGQTADPDEPPISALACSCCGGRMIVIETFEPGHPPRAPPQAKADRT